ncbi:hypothetical protein [uncultured Kordia sp.]|uniref:hypothetical protein n=1 Tax=uncultured Kordia sp. TaxID=507699 RepID=UPI00262C9C20|nr:hypothetical protein [uncultured Kordia sp.]
MDYLDQEKFGKVFCFFDCHGEFLDPQSFKACIKLRNTVDDLMAQGLTKYEAIMEVCKQVHISFEILLKQNHVITITTFMNNKEWSHNTFQGNRFDATKFIASELYKMLYIKFENIVFIEEVSE